MKKLLVLLLFIPLICFSQLHHSTISLHSLNSSNNEVKVLQSVGQLSLIGNFSSSKVSVIQGFQQPFIRNINERPIVNQNIISYPNPFYSDLNIEFINNKPKKVRIDIFDISGRFIKSLESKDFDNILNLDLEGLQSSEYIINVKGNGINYSTKVIKK
jgi:hypothetical protein